MIGGRREDAGARVELRGLATGWDAGRSERLLSGVHARIDRRRRVWRAALASAGVASAVVIAVFALRADRAPAPEASRTPASTPASAPPGLIRLRDGSEIRLDPATAEVRVLEETPTRVHVELTRGSSRYAVTTNPGRAFEVHAGPVTVKVVGTEFVVERRGAATWVAVTRGKVAVSSGDGEAPALLGAGDAGLFPREPASAPAPVAVSERAQRSRQSYRSEIARRDYRRAYAELARNPALAGDTVDDLLVAADVARLSDHPAEAVPYLQRILRDHARDARAPMAAFTLGRTLSGLGRTREAMASFARVRNAWPQSPLAEDALVREAEAAAALGDLATAAGLAAQYDRSYPDGRRRAEVRRHARID
jgi:transmembrane sensor